MEILEAQMNVAKGYEIEAKVACLKDDFETAIDRLARIMDIFNQMLPTICVKKGQLTVPLVWYTASRVHTIQHCLI
jgi:hypothetical protein